MSAISEQAVVDGRRVPLAHAALLITDEGVARGDGAFETVGVWDGVPFRLDDHLERLGVSMQAIGLPAPDVERLRDDVAGVLEGAGTDGVLRLYVTGSGTRVATLTGPPDRPPAHRLVPQPAPWIRPLGTYAPAGAKTMSYGANMAASRAAQRAGGDDALLVSLEGWVLEGPTFCVLWVSGDHMRTPTVELGIVDSISRRTLTELAAEAGYPVEEGRWTLDDLADADEFMICSSIRDVLPVHTIGERVFAGRTPVRDALSAALDSRRRGR